MTQISIKKCAVPPAVLIEQNMKTATSLNLWNARSLKAADIKILEVPIELKADTIAPPTIEFANQRTTHVGPRFTWKGERFIVPTGCGRWAAYAFLSGREHQHFERVNFQKFIDMYVRQCKMRGITIEYPNETGLYGSSFADIEECFKYSRENKFEFVLAVHGDSGDDAHAGVKFAEQQYQIVSPVSSLWNYEQRCKEESASDCRELRAKDALNKNTLYIGIGSSHPGGGFKMSSEVLPQKEVAEGCKTTYPAPTVVGFSANVGPSGSFDFAGDFVFQQPQCAEKVDVIASIVKRCANMFQHARAAFPERVIIYRGGCSEGQFRMVLEYEVPLIKYAFRQLGCDQVKLTVISVTKLQEVRFFNKMIDSTQKPDVQNIQPGVVIDHTVVHPIFREFFLNSHRTLHGTARTPRYTILLDENNMNLAQVQSMSYHLCYGHQIVYLPTSLPSPVYIANLYAERGRKIYQHYMTHVGNQQLDYEQLSAELSFQETDLIGYRVNA